MNADVIDVYNGGLKAFETGKIQGTVWFDKDYSGLQETGESAMPTQQTVYLDQYYLTTPESGSLSRQIPFRQMQPQVNISSLTSRPL